eukprot:14020522-Heterocapsa_arctica.AAC.1
MISLKVDEEEFLLAERSASSHQAALLSTSVGQARRVLAALLSMSTVPAGRKDGRPPLGSKPPLK